ncbi:MAG: putative tryptophan/tyrosine transport system substrate-binding protein [Candidatus Dependentiae bacterium]|nr:putative tryptophan/tyrosine transport system substrate-binding protein [Candidatus Dependentiae bacterium]
MKKYATPFLFISAFVLTLGIGYLAQQPHTTKHTEPVQKAWISNGISDIPIVTEEIHQSDVLTIGVLVYGCSPLVEALITEFEKTFKKATGKTCRIHLHTAEENYTILNAMAHKLLNARYDLIWAIGAQPAQAIAGLIPKHRPTTPIMLSSLPWSTLNELIQENPSLKKYATGWGGSYNWKHRIEILKKFVLNIKQVLFLYNISRDSSCLDEVKSELDQRGIGYKEIGIENTNTTFNYLRNTLDDIDVIIVLRDSGIVPAMTQLVSLGNNYHVPIFVSDALSIERGAACGACSHEESFSHYCVWFAKEMLIRKKKPYNLSFMHIKDWDIEPILNKETSSTALQNTGTPKNIEFLMKHGIVIKESKHRNQRAAYDV